MHSVKEVNFLFQEMKKLKNDFVFQSNLMEEQIITSLLEDGPQYTIIKNDKENFFPRKKILGYLSLSLFIISGVIQGECLHYLSNLGYDKGLFITYFGYVPFLFFLIPSKFFFF